MHMYDLTCFFTLFCFHLSCSLSSRKRFTLLSLYFAVADDCDSSPCRHGGTCSGTTSGFECQCPRRYLGEFCERHDCVINPCQNGAFCVTCPNSFFCPSITDRGFQCSCRSGFQGALCDLDVNECQQIAGLCKNGGTCVNTFGGYTCTCRQDYTGSKCETYGRMSACRRLVLKFRWMRVCVEACFCMEWVGEGFLM